jgi:hypothetical protein
LKSREQTIMNPSLQNLPQLESMDLETSVNTAKYHQLEHHIHDIESRINRCSQTLKSQLQLFATSINTATKQCIHDTLKKFRVSPQSAIETELNKLDMALTNRHNLFIEQLNSTVDKIIQDVYSAADEAHKTMIQTNKEVMATIYEATEKITNFMLYIPLIETLKENYNLIRDEIHRIQPIRKSRTPLSRNRQSANDGHMLFLAPTSSHP